MGFKAKETINHIVKWMNDYADGAGIKGFVIGISGGIDSAVTSTMCAMTGKKVICLNMPIYQKAEQVDRAEEHILWLKEQYPDVTSLEVDLSETFDMISDTLPDEVNTDGLTMANTRARLRMTTLYAFAGHHKYLVAGTGNKVEDFGVGFYTKYGDGGVDISPIADLMKTQVFALAKELNVVDSIQKARPTDGLWEDDRTDEEQLGASYPELEWAMTYLEENQGVVSSDLSEQQKNIIEVYLKFHNANKHKMKEIPVCEIPLEFKK